MYETQHNTIIQQTTQDTTTAHTKHTQTQTTRVRTTSENQDTHTNKHNT